MTRNPKQTRPSLAIADWKDVDGLLDDLAKILKPRGIILQVHDLGSDDWFVTVADRKLTKADLKREFELDWLADAAPPT